MYTYMAMHGLKDGNTYAQAIGAFTFFTLYLLKVCVCVCVFVCVCV
jgi:hypothetical protein